MGKWILLFFLLLLHEHKIVSSFFTHLISNDVLLFNYPIPSSIKDWDVSEINDMSYLFSQKDTCNPDIGSWDVSGVENFVSSIATNLNVIFYDSTFCQSST